jgi:F-type H+-transporting ATPase subunit delta
MAITKISTRYASSFLQIAVEKKILDNAAADMELIVDSLKSSRELRRAVESPVIRSETKQSILIDIFSGKVHNETMNFIKFIINKGRESALSSIAARFLELRDEHLGVVQAEITSAFDLSEQQKEEMRNSFENTLGKKVNCNYQINKNLLGGFVAKVGDTVYDASVMHQLNLLKNHFVKVDISLN